jgi:predicted acylesterase/phospholipase RssA
MIIPPRKITLSGGGMKGFAHIGALEVLQERGLLRGVREYIGISAGALCAFCICVGCSLAEIRAVIEKLDFSLVRHLDPEVMLGFPETFGLDSGENLRKLIASILRGKKFPPTLTFRDLAAAEVAPALRIYATNLNTCCTEEFSARATPDTEIAFALQASMTIPVYFQPMRHPVTGQYFVDGGVICHSPFKFLTAEERAQTLSITFSDTHKPKETVEGVLGYLIQIYHTLDFQYNDELTAPYPYQVMFLDCGDFNSLEFEASAETKQAILARGRAAAARHLDSVPAAARAAAPARRFSIG